MINLVIGEDHMNKSENLLRILVTTVNTLDAAKNIARKVIENKLAACVNIIPINSIYYWRNKIVDEKEFMLLIKTSAEQVNALREWIINNHPYEVPEILIMYSESNKEYFNWLIGYVKNEAEP